VAPLFILLALVAQAAPQPAWRPIGVAGNGRQTFYDPASVVRAGPVTRVRLRFTEEAAYVLTTVEIRCAAYEARVLGTATYANDGTERDRNELTTPFRAIVAGGFLDTLARDLCGAAQGPAAEE
jgi:hypothetical protein